MTLSLRNIAKTFPGEQRALMPTDLDIHEGEIVALLGPSGCGKTTLLRMIAGLETPDSGSQILFDGVDVTQRDVEKRQVGMVFQSYALFPNMSVRANIAYGLKMQGRPKAEINTIVDELVVLCQLQPYLDRAVTELSGGQRQRVALARAVAPRPKYLLLDEPLSALDAALRMRLRDELAQLLRQFGITAIFVTHDQDEAMTIADRIVLMSNGKVAQIGDPETLYRQPENAFVAQFIGDAMALDGNIEGDMLELHGGTLRLPTNAEKHSVFARAEDIKLDSNGSLQGTVAGVTFLGTHYRIAISGVCKSMLFAHHIAPSAPAIGETVRINIPTSSLLVLAN